jgi:hypothetical protein
MKIANCKVQIGEEFKFIFSVRSVFSVAKKGGFYAMDRRSQQSDFQGSLLCP